MDGWTDLNDNKQMDWQFTSAPDGNIALMGEVPLPQSGEFCLAVSFSPKRHGALATLAESLAVPFADHLRKFKHQWERATAERGDDLTACSFDNGSLLRMSHNLLLAHEDKTCHGAMIASLSIPWGEVKGDEDLGGYHLVWTRDMVNSATGLMAAGETATPLRALIYLASTQLDNGGFYQNFWIDVQPYWQGIQLDEVAFPIVLAWRLQQADALELFDPYPMVKAAAVYLVKQDAATAQERWEENSGDSPSTLAAHISGLVCGSLFAQERGDDALATYFVEYADFLEQHLEGWTVTDCGTILPDVPRHYIRMLPIDLSNPTCEENPNTAEMFIKNRPADLKSVFPARDIVDAGFLELVRYGIRPADDRLIVDSLKVVDKLLKIDTPNGPCWRRYPHDGYGQRADGGPYNGVGQGRAWPRLTGERAHYELATGARGGAKFG
jgi:glucoamylase